MKHPVAAITLLIVMVILIVGVDVAIFRHNLLPRFLFNVGTVLVFISFYYRYLK